MNLLSNIFDPSPINIILHCSNPPKSKLNLIDLADNSNKTFPIIGVGGIHSEKDALDKISAGADLVQIYTGFIYKGPSLIAEIINPKN